MPDDDTDTTRMGRRGALGAIATAAAGLGALCVPDSLSTLASGLLDPIPPTLDERYAYRDGFAVGKKYLLSDGYRVYPRFGPKEWREWDGERYSHHSGGKPPWEGYYELVMGINDNIAAGRREIVGVTDDGRPVFWTGDGDRPGYFPNP